MVELQEKYLLFKIYNMLIGIFNFLLVKTTAKTYIFKLKVGKVWLK